MLVELEHQADAFSLAYIHQLHGFMVTMKYFSIAQVTEMVSKPVISVRVYRHITSKPFVNSRWRCPNVVKLGI